MVVLICSRVRFIWCCMDSILTSLLHGWFYLFSGVHWYEPLFFTSEKCDIYTEWCVQRSVVLLSSLLPCSCSPVPSTHTHPQPVWNQVHLYFILFQGWSSDKFSALNLSASNAAVAELETRAIVVLMMSYTMK